MSIHNTLTSLKIFCVASSGKEHEWYHKGNYYRWNLGRENSKDFVNGVVRKRQGKNKLGEDTWKLAGSFKIDANGKILRFTGLGKKVQKTFLTKTSLSVELI